MRRLAAALTPCADMEGRFGDALGLYARCKDAAGYTVELYAWEGGLAVHVTRPLYGGGPFAVMVLEVPLPTPDEAYARAAAVADDRWLDMEHGAATLPAALAARGWTPPV